MIDLKRLLMEFGNKMVLEHQFEPSGPMPYNLREELQANTTTELITMLTHWINIHPEAQQALKELGVTWRM